MELIKVKKKVSILLCLSSQLLIIQPGIVPSCCEAPTKKNLCWTAAIKKNYRPVSNLPLLSKVHERLVLKQPLSHLAQNDLNEMFQSAYRKHHSTETAILRVCNDFFKGADDRKVNLQALLDLSAAFDTIDHNIKRLESSFGVKGPVC